MTSPTSLPLSVTGTVLMFFFTIVSITSATWVFRSIEMSGVLMISFTSRFRIRWSWCWSKELLPRYFDKDGENFRIKPELKRLVSFGQLNLSDRVALKRVERSQLVFCRNVIIYFDDEMKKKVIGAFYDNLQPGGYMLIGHSESLHNITRSFKPIHYPGAIMYKKEA